MAATKTSLASPITSDALILNATSSAGATVNGLVLIDGEYAYITTISGNTIGLRSRGSNGTVARPHVTLAPVTFGLGSDFPDPAPGQTVPRVPLDWDQRSVAIDQTFDPGTQVFTRNTTVYITKATPWLQTITGPSQGQDGQQVQFVSTTAAAHVMTYLAGFSANTTASDVATFAATFGATFTIQAQNGKWLAVSSTGVTIA